MIDPDWTVIDLDPRTWRNIGHFFEVPQYVRTSQPGENALFVLHDNGRPLNVYDSRRGLRPELIAGPIDDPQLLAHELFETGQWDRVHVINKQHLIEVARQAQTIEDRALTLDAYYHRVFQLVWQNPQGYVSLPPHPGHWHAWTYTQIKDFITRLSKPASLALGVLEGGEVAIGLILLVSEGLIRRVTTFEALTLTMPLTVSTASFEHLWLSLRHQFAPPAAALLCTRSAFDQWITAGDKAAVIRNAALKGEAFWRMT